MFIRFEFYEHTIKGKMSSESVGVAKREAEVSEGVDDAFSFMSCHSIQIEKVYLQANTYQKGVFCNVVYLQKRRLQIRRVYVATACFPF